MAKLLDSEHRGGKDADAQSQGGNVYLFPQGRRRKKKNRSAYPTEDELREYREMLGMLRQIVKEFPELKRMVEQNTFVHSNCVIAQSILKGESP